MADLTGHQKTDINAAIYMLERTVKDTDMPWKERHMYLQLAAGTIDAISISYHNAMIEKDTI